MACRYVVLAGLVPLAAATRLVAQTVPTSQPKVLQIIREIEKPAHTPAHEATEARWTEFNRKSGYPSTYLGLVSASGPAEMWWLSSYDNFAGLGKASAFGGDNPSFTQGVARLIAEDSDHLSNVITMQARGMPEVSNGPFPEMAKIRVTSILTVRMKPGYENAFAEISSHYKMAAQGNASLSWSSYEVVAGAPAGTYLVFSSFPSWEGVDANDAAWASAMSGASAHLEAAGKLAKEAIMSSEVRYFTVNPRISLVPKEMAAADPFWATKPAPAPVRKAVP